MNKIILEKSTKRLLFKDYSGQIFNNVKVLKHIGYTEKIYKNKKKNNKIFYQRNPAFNCLCLLCGKEFVCRSIQNILKGSSKNCKSCGYKKISLHGFFGKEACHDSRYFIQIFCNKRKNLPWKICLDFKNAMWEDYKKMRKIYKRLSLVNKNGKWTFIQTPGVSKKFFVHDGIERSYREWSDFLEVSRERIRQLVVIGKLGARIKERIDALEEISNT